MRERFLRSVKRTRGVREIKSEGESDRDGEGESEKSESARDCERESAHALKRARERQREGEVTRVRIGEAVWERHFSLECVMRKGSSRHNWLSLLAPEWCVNGATKGATFAPKGPPFAPGV